MLSLFYIKYANISGIKILRCLQLDHILAKIFNKHYRVKKKKKEKKIDKHYKRKKKAPSFKAEFYILLKIQASL